MRYDSFVDTEVANDPDFTANTAAPAEFAATVSVEGFFGNPGGLYGLMTINGPRYYFHDLGEGLDGECEQLNRRLHARLEKDDDYLRRFIEACSPGNGICMEECIDELLDEESLPSARRIAQAYLRDHENLKLDFDPSAPLSEMPEVVCRQILDWKKAHYEGSSWEDSGLSGSRNREAVHRPGFRTENAQLFSIG